MINLDALKQQHSEETKDAEMYKRLADENPEWERVLHDIAHDEQKHAEMLKHIIEHTK